ncbi:MAG: ketoacyl-ACP synthase III [Bacteroidales bacterium]|jgi:3-oxoacyl-[acyl-carrier-protein] synthase-3|nr:ketoacyl-ACP synthase III [Bacteroidales bacterium]
MRLKRYSIIKGTGSFVPEVVVKNEAFLQNKFYEKNGVPLEKSNEEIIEKFREITEIEERRYAREDQNTDDLAFLAARNAIEDSGIDPEDLDYVIVAHNYGNVYFGSTTPDTVPSIASRVKHKLGIKNPGTVAYDLPFGCPGWVQAVIHADYFIKSGDASLALVIGAETLSRISDPHDIDSMIYSDGAGAVVLESVESEIPVGILAHKTRSDTLDHYKLLWMDKSNKPDYPGDDLFIKMLGRKVYEYAITHVPVLVKECMEKAGVGIGDVKKILIHQANGKMDYVIVQKTLRLFKAYEKPENIMPMIIARQGNNSVGTVPILLDMIMKKKMDHHTLEQGDHFVMASVGAGMNINAIVYRIV